MKRIKPNRCGYISGYTCKGVGSWSDNSDSQDMINGSRTELPWEKIPQHLEGFVMTLTPILDMDATVEVPELDCRVELNPFKVLESSKNAVLNASAEYTSIPGTQHDGFLDMYNYVPKYKNSVYVTVDGSTTSVKASDYTCESGSVMGPGILEPMVDTEFSPITVDTIPGPDAYFDATTYLFDVFSAWRDLVDTRLNNLHSYVQPFDTSSINGMLNLTNASNVDGLCSNFRIRLSSTSAVVLGTTVAVPTYTVTGGTIKINGVDDVVAGNTYTGEFDAYVDILESTNYSGSYYGILRRGIPDVPETNHIEYLYVGSVKKVVGSSVTPFPGESYTLYEIHQGDCITDVAIGGSGTYANPYKGPFYVEATGSTTAKVTGFDVSGGTPKAGKVYIDGGLANYAPIGTGITISNSGYVYAHVEVAPVTGSTAYSYVGCTYDTVEGSTSSTTGNKMYTVRLAGCFVSGTTSGISLQQIHYGDIYIDTTGPVIQDGGGMGYYSGPFHLSSIDLGGGTSGWGVYGVVNGIAGDIYFNGVKIGGASAGSVGGTMPSTNKYVYAHVNVTTTTAGTTYNSCSYSYSETPPSTTGTNYTIRLAQILASGEYKQFHYGDIYLYGSTSTAPVPVQNAYRGPFTITAEGISCPACGSTVQGYYRINGGVQHVVSGQSVTFANDATTDIYLHITGQNSAVIDTTNEGDTGTPPHYTVWLGQVKMSGGSVTEINQIHYGEVFVDGRWS